MVVSLSWCVCFRMTPLDCAVVGGHHEVANVLTEYGGVSIATIEHVACTKIQVCREMLQLAHTALLRAEREARSEALK